MRGGGIKFEIAGAKELAANLRALPPNLQKGVIRRTLLKVGQPIADAAQANLSSIKLKPKITASTTLSRRQRRGSRKEKGVTTVYIGCRPGPLAHLFEFGTADRYTTGGGDARGKAGRAAKAQGKGGAFRGRMRATPFMRPAWDGGKDKALGDLGRIMGREIEATAARLARKNARAARR
jgi:HK97 gp10 family phage protein